ncbi:MAG TPA: histidine kinase [Candidatus Limnocylindria bacterium]|nr:histidine kinase [Candidatus Limnocylindria bacterium]
MKQKILELSERYGVALQNHLKQAAPVNFAAALELGRLAVSCRVETLELARIHEQAVLALEFLTPKVRTRREAARFFDEAITPIVETHRAMRQGRTDLLHVNQDLKLRTAELATANLQLQKGVVQRKNVEASLKMSGLHYSKLLKESLQLQEGLRQLTHRVLTAQEDERKKISIELQDEIAQTLLGINARLVSIKQEAKGDRHGIKSEIESTQRLVARSTQSIKRVARDFRKL